MTKRRPPENTDANAKVGYGRPPLHTRFKPGQSGNPAGRPRRNKDTFENDLHAELMQDVVLNTENGRKTYRIQELYAKFLKKRAFNGDFRALEQLRILTNGFQVVERMGGQRFRIVDGTRALEQFLAEELDDEIEESENNSSNEQDVDIDDDQNS